MQAEQKAEQVVGSTNTQANSPVKKFMVRPLRTYEEDLANYVKKEKVSTATIVLAEQKKREHKEEVSEKEAKSQKINKKMLTLSLGLLFGGALVAASIFLIIDLVKNSGDTPINAFDLNNEILDKTVHIKINTDNRGNAEIRDEIVGFINNPPVLKNREIAEFQTYAKNPDESLSYVKSERLLEILNFNPPGALARALGDSYVFGLMKVSDRTLPFLLLDIEDYGPVFGEMFNWEKYLVREVNDIFFGTLGLNDFIVVNPENNTSQYNPENFEDRIMHNKDTRAIVSNGGEILFLYTFVNQDKLLMTGDPEILDELVRKINLQNVVR